MAFALCITLSLIDCLFTYILSVIAYPSSVPQIGIHRLVKFINDDLFMCTINYSQLEYMNSIVLLTIYFPKFHHFLLSFWVCVSVINIHILIKLPCKWFLSCNNCYYCDKNMFSSAIWENVCKLCIMSERLILSLH